MASSPSPTRNPDAMSTTTDPLTTHLIHLVRRVQHQLGTDDLTDAPDTPFADALDSMGLVEFVAILAGECGVAPQAIEECVHRRFGTIADLAAAMSAAGLRPVGPACRAGPAAGPARQAGPPGAP